MYTYKYPRPEVTADCVVLAPDDADRLSVLLVRRGGEPYKDCWALPGGFMNIDEDAPAAARRELQEETGVRVGQIMQLGAYTRPDRDPRGRVISIAFVALLNGTEPAAGADDAAQARWFPVDQVPALAFDHQKILHDALELMSYKL